METDERGFSFSEETPHSKTYFHRDVEGVTYFTTKQTMQRKGKEKKSTLMTSDKICCRGGNHQEISEHFYDHNEEAILLFKN